ncbi:riboflavin transport system permease protein RibX [Ktedonospora formicarum]|uniref:Riboflavin transport system permease protein RibX n=2 Tax=Ktedonospora formicarum TaxID=2778364 RepID=A0A8J3HYB6_9CHLR|nr:riboflavin transport system permease protein RibX [Ktedonospora formicarum]
MAMPAHLNPSEHVTARSPRRHAETNQRRLTWSLSVAPPVLVAIILLIGWYVSTTSGYVNALFLPAPADVLQSLSDGISSGIYLNNLLVTLEESLIGFFLALVIAIPLGYGLSKSRVLAAAIHPYLAAGQAIPVMVIAPLLVLWLGYGWVPNMYVCTLVVFFPMVVNTVLGIQVIDRALTDAARVEGASGWSLFAYIEFPLALPSIIAGVRTGLTLSIVGAMVGEFVQGGDAGLGSLLLVAKNQYNTPLMFATLFVLAVLAIVFYGSTWLLSKIANAIY